MAQKAEETTQTRVISTYEKAKIIAVSKNIHKSTVGNLWCVEGSKKGSFYKVEYIDGELRCQCPAFLYGMTNPCKHILSIAVREIGI